MGWTFTARPRGESDRTFFRGVFDGPQGEVVDVARRKFVVYVAYRQKDTGRTFAVICLTRQVRDAFNFGFKDIDEFSGSYERECPERILDRLSPLEAFEGMVSAQGLTWAREWREACRAYWAAQHRRVPLTKGTVVRTPTPLTFTTGNREDLFLIVDGRRLCSHAISEVHRRDGEVEYYVGSTPLKLRRRSLQDARDVTEDIKPLIRNADYMDMYLQRGY